MHEGEGDGDGGMDNENRAEKGRKRKKETIDLRRFIHDETEDVMVLTCIPDAVGEELMIEVAHGELTPEETGDHDPNSDGDRWTLMTLFRYKIPDYLNAHVYQSNQ